MTRRPPGFTILELVIVISIISVLIAMLLPAVQAAREAARRTQCANNLLQIGIALENYEATNQVLPPGVVDRSGPVIETPTSYQFGWICRILPYLEQKNVYRNLDFNTGVYSPINLTARAVAMSVLLCPSDGNRSNGRGGVSNLGAGGTLGLPDPSTTAYAACHHDVEGPIDVKNTGVFFLNSRVRSEDIEDGLAHTIFVGEKRTPGDELGWASGTRATLRNTGTPINQTNLDPADLAAFMGGFVGSVGSMEAGGPSPASAPPPGAPTPIPVGGFGSYHPNGANFLMGDGSVRLLRSTISLPVFRLLGNRADGEPIGDDRF
jgi:prepilin-type processing-associated H-X9-DG protein/prepilin-type N-terminal cleavage/methylation domain-containing protein